MRHLNEQEFIEAPRAVQFIYTMTWLKQPISSATYEDAMKNHPEYFQEDDSTEQIVTTT